MKRTLGFLVYGLAAVVLAVMLIPSLRPGGHKDETAKTETAPVSFRSIEQLVQSTGEIVAAKATDIRCEVSGKVAKLNVKPGDRVSAGQVMVELDDAELKSEEHESAFRVQASRLRRDRAKMDYDRKAQLREKNFVMDKELEDSKTELDLATNAVDTDGARLQTLRERLVKSVIKAPHDGTVLNLRVREGVVVTGANISGGEATLILQVADLAQLQVLSEINEVDVIKLSIGRPATVTFDSVPGVALAGEVNFISPSALPKDKDRTVRVFSMIVSLAQASDQVKPGISAKVTISAAKNPKTLAVSMAAVFVENNEPCAFVKTASGFERRVVELGINDTAFVEIKQGLKEGEQVALQHPPVPAAS